MLFLLEFVIFCGDIIGYQLALSKAYSVINYVNAYIEEKGEVDDEIQIYVEQTLKSNIICADTCHVSSGSNLDYHVEIPYRPVLAILQKNTSGFVITQRVYIK